MQNPNVLLAKIEQTGLWAYFHKDWLLQMRGLLRPQLPPEFHLFVESEAILISPEHALAVTTVLPDVSLATRKHGTDGTDERLAAPISAAVIEVEESYETFTQYSLVIRRAPENLVVAALEVLSPSNKGLGNAFDRERHLRKRRSLLDAAVNLLEIDALVAGDRALPAALADLDKFNRNVWTASHRDGRRKLRGWGWNQVDPLPIVPWRVVDQLEVLVDLPVALEQAREFNRWDELVE